MAHDCQGLFLSQHDLFVEQTCDQVSCEKCGQSFAFATWRKLSNAPYKEVSSQQHAGSKKSRKGRGRSALGAPDEGRLLCLRHIGRCEQALCGYGGGGGGGGVHICTWSFVADMCETTMARCLFERPQLRLSVRGRRPLRPPGY